jgi:hypothetical protein
MMRLGRLRFYAYLGLPILILLGGARLVLSSGFAANKVAVKLTALLGVPVRVSGVDIGLGRSTRIQNLHIFEDDAVRPDAPWVAAADVQADFSAVDILGDDLPKEVVLSGAHIELRFDKDGSLLTRLPKSTSSTQSMPKLRLENAQVTIKQDGRERRPLVATGVNADFTYADGAFRFEGQCTDSFWGEWTVKGSYDVGNDVFRLTLHTDRAAVSAERLALVPFVADEVWEEVRIAEGVTSEDLDLTVRGETVNYRIVLKPENTRVRISSIDLDADRTANGTIGTEADLDFSGDVAHLDFTSIWVKDVELQKLPESWKPKGQAIYGKLEGNAKLDVLVKPAGVEMNGTGTGMMRNATFNREKLDVLNLEMKARGDSLRILPVLIPGFKLPFG